MDAVSFNNSTVTDLLGWYVNAAIYAEAVRFWVDEADSTLVATPFDLDVILSLYGATITAGTGSSSATPVLWDTGDSACSELGWRGQTSALATTSGSKRLLWAKGVHTSQGCDVVLPEPIPCLQNQGCVLQLNTAPSLAIKLSAGQIIRERG
jgi:hypothetical protein